MLSLEAFVYLENVFTFFAVILLGLFIMLVFLKKYAKLINWFTVISISIISIAVSSSILIFLGYAADEVNYQSSGFGSVYMYIVIIVLPVINSYIAFENKV